MIKLICCDLDGTLLNSKKEITEENKKAIKEFTNRGGHFVIATGRPLMGVYNIIKELGLTKKTDTTITYNGGVIMKNNNKEIISTTTISGKIVKEVYKESVRLGAYFHFFSDKNELFTTEPNEFTAVEERINHISAKVIDINEVSDNASYIKCMIVGPKEILDEARQKLRPELNRLAIVRSSNIFLEFQSKDVSKGIGLKFLKKYYNLSDNETMALGDEENDLSMIKEAFIGVAMENGSQVVKSCANYITDSNESSGVGKAIIKYAL
jgi:Cof subfamily protein (haloacid dehalogenase superfamily)